MKTKRGKPWMPNAVNSVFYVNNDPEGLAFLKELKSHLNGANYKIRLEGRNPDRKQFRDDQKGWRGNARLQSSLRNDESTYYAVYVDFAGKKKKIESEQSSRGWERTSQLEDEVNRLRKYSRNLEREVAELQQGLVNTQIASQGRKYKLDELPDLAS